MAINEVMLDTMRYIDRARSTEDVVRAWHDDTHAGRFDHCTEQPCHAVTRREAPVHGPDLGAM